MLKSSTGKLYTLLTACKPDNARIKKRLLITEIIEMPEYKALQVYQGAASVMDDHYSPIRLQEAEYNDLLEIKLIIPILEACIRKLYEIICFGDVRIIHEIKRKLKGIQFYSSESIKNLYQMIKDVKNTGVNITNIPEFDVWSVFSRDAILSLDEHLFLFDSNDIDSLESQIIEEFEDYTYCISAKEIAEKRKAYRDIFRKNETIRIRLQIVENKIFIKKLIWSLISIILIMTQFSNSAVFFSKGGRIISFIIYLIILIAYWIWG